MSSVPLPSRSPRPADGRGGHTIVFVGGLHRSGTTPLARCLATHPQVSAFSGTGVKEDEGQHLQDVYPPARVFGGPGRFAFAPGAHLTEESPLATPENAARLLGQWRPHWDLTRPVLVEKTPSNLVSTRFLQALVPEARFVVVVRHPVVVTLSTKKWNRGRSLASLMAHWFQAHDLLTADAPRVSSLCVVKYEDLVRTPVPTLRTLADFLGLEADIPPDVLRGDRSTRYEQQWQGLARDWRPWRRATHARLVDRFEERALSYGYSLRDLSYLAPLPL